MMLPNKLQKQGFIRLYVFGGILISIAANVNKNCNLKAVLTQRYSYRRHIRYCCEFSRRIRDILHSRLPRMDGRTRGEVRRYFR